MWKILVVSILLCFATIAYADVYADWGIAFDHPNDGTYSEVQNYALGYQKKLSMIWDRDIETGGWKDGSRYPDTEASLYTSCMFGIQLTQPERYASYFIGPAIISTTDALLGSPFQIEHKLGIGWRDTQDKHIGFYIKHFSNAGLSKVNYGRNFIGLEISFK